MNDQNKTIALHKKKLDNIKKHNKFYYINDKPKISDSEYDKLKKEIFELEKKYPYLKKIDTISKIVGSSPSSKFKKIKHDYRL